MKFKILFILLITIFLSGCNKKTNMNQEPISKSSFLLNTIVTITLYDSTDLSILDECLDLCKKYEALFSRTVDTSEISILNNSEDFPIEVSKETCDLLNYGLYYSNLSDGAFDITIGSISSLWNFTAENPAIPDEALLKQAVQHVDYKKVICDENKVTFSDPDISLDLGAIAKGYIADRIKDYLISKRVKSAIINLGGNVLCVGSKPDGTPFKIGIQKPFEDRNEPVTAVEITGWSVVSSGIYERYFKKEGVNYHHILDPKTGYPYQNDLVAVTILSEKSVDGDGLSTICFSLGLHKGMELINSIPDTYAIFITSDGSLNYSEGFEDTFHQISD